MGMDDQIADMQTLHRVLKQMAVPEHRMQDYPWLLGNLWVKNKDHKDYKSAMSLLNTLIERQRHISRAV